jgi:hypothetical protein
LSGRQLKSIEVETGTPSQSDYQFVLDLGRFKENFEAYMLIQYGKAKAAGFERQVWWNSTTGEGYRKSGAAAGGYGQTVTVHLGSFHSLSATIRAAEKDMRDTPWRKGDTGPR